MTFSEPIESSSLTKCRNFINAFEGMDSQTKEDFFEDGKNFPHYLVKT